MDYQCVDFRYLTTNDPCDDKWMHWSRVYEWETALEKVKQGNYQSIHNTSCGGLDKDDCLHLTFCRELESLCPDVTHSDVWGENWIVEDKPESDNFVYYDITQPFEDRKFDLVLNISTMEHLEPLQQVAAARNLLTQVNPGGKLIVTLDYPSVDIRIMQVLFGVKAFAQPNMIQGPQGLNVLYMEIDKIAD